MVVLPVPVPVQAMLDKIYPAGTDSVMLVTADTAARVCVVPETAVPDVAVVIVCDVSPLSPLKENGPTAPLLIFRIVTVGNLLLVNVHAILEPAAVAAASNVTAPVARLGV